MQVGVYQDSNYIKYGYIQSHYNYIYSLDAGRRESCRSLVYT